MKLHRQVCGLIFLTLALIASFQSSAQTLNDTGIVVYRDRVTGADTQVTQSIDCSTPKRTADRMRALGVMLLPPRVL